MSDKRCIIVLTKMKYIKRKGLVAMTKRQMMVEAHRIAREELKGDYQARLSLALRQLWKKKKGENKMDRDVAVIERWWVEKNAVKFETLGNKNNEFDIIKETEKAVLIKTGTVENWIPKSVVEFYSKEYLMEVKEFVKPQFDSKLQKKAIERMGNEPDIVLGTNQDNFHILNEANKELLSIVAPDLYKTE